MHIRTFLPALALALSLTACEQFNLADADTETGSTGNANVVVHLSAVSTPMSRASETVKAADCCTRLQVALFSGTERKASVAQTIDDEDFGDIEFYAEPGTYRLVAIGHSGQGNATLTAPTEVKFYKNKVTETFYHYGTLTVAETDGIADEYVDMQRAVAMFRLHIEDDIPENVSQLKFYYTGGSSTLDATEGTGCVNSKQTELRTVSTTQKDYDVYTFPHADGKKLKMVVTALGADDEEIATKTFENVEVKRNYITTYSGRFFDQSSESGFTFRFQTDWDGEINKSF